ncbi:DNA phosphorothioation-dependent restriction protein DptH [Endozoicomonas arenosclerae]|uniref:DNA phosphorothioation-dependent restriction protein DptH n=1 Tax=Endozoicomonas arenosclerae TaxID=1633495 RepID=UPI000782B6A7|nr:DNA phosphorothioation-dependent restriction protein DptH [Endozoicomonas arenosclerae]
MYAVQFEQFAVERIKGWLDQNIKAGEKYQLRSTNLSNTQRLYDEICKCTQSFVYDGTELHYLMVNGVKVIFAAHFDEQEAPDHYFNEYYISHLRDCVSDKSGTFVDTALVFIHNSSLDTLVKNAVDLAHGDMPWSAQSIEEQLNALIDGQPQNNAVLSHLLKVKAEQLKEDGGSMFGFVQLYTAMTSGGSPDLSELGFLPDKGLWELSKPNQIENRLKDNKEFHDKLERTLQNHPEEIHDRIPELGEKFIDDHFSDPSSDGWRTKLDMGDVITERKKQKENIVSFVSVSSDNAKLTGPRTKSEKGAGKREKHIILEVPKGSEAFDLRLTFDGDDLKKEQLQLINNKVLRGLKNSIIKVAGSAQRHVTVNAPFDGSPTFFTLKVKRTNNNECFTFQVLVLEEGDFYLPAIENKFLVKPNQSGIILQTEDMSLALSEQSGQEFVLSENEEVVDASSYASLDYQQVYEDSEVVSFVVQNSGHSVKFTIEGEASPVTLTLPILMDSDRFNELFNDDRYGQFINAKGKVVIDHKESKVPGIRLPLLRREEEFLTEQQISIGPDAIKAEQLATVSPEIHSAWTELSDYLIQRKSLLSLEFWGDKLTSLVRNYVQASLEYLSAIPMESTLSDENRIVLAMGMAEFEDKKYFSPYHPLILSYYLQLVDKIQADCQNKSFRNLPPVTLERLNPKGLLPYVYSKSNQFSYTQKVKENPLWLEIVPQKDTSYSYVSTLVKEKSEEFIETFNELFKQVDDAPLIINSVNNGDNSEVFMGLLAYFKKNLAECHPVHVNLYDDKFCETEFDIFAEMSSHEEIKQRYSLDKGAAREQSEYITDLLRTKLSFSKFKHKDVAEQSYAHLSFFKNNQKVTTFESDIDKFVSGIACHGLLSGEASVCENKTFQTAYGLNKINTEDQQHLEMSRLYGRLLKPCVEPNQQYHAHSSIGIAVSDSFKEQLERSYDSSIWTTIIDPKVTLDFFQQEQDLILIHYSDQYTNSAGYDAITVTRQSDLYKKMLSQQGDQLIEEFNAFNGEWLLKMVTDPDKEKKGKLGIVASWKLVSAMLSQSDIIWIPISIAEMVRVSGNIGLKMDQHDFGVFHNKDNYSGKMSDDILFAGFKDNKLFILPVEVKAGEHGSTSLEKAREQAEKLRAYLVERILGPKTLEGRIYRSLFIRQVLMQIEKYQLYEVFEADYFKPFLNEREQWLTGDYELGSIEGFPEAMVLAHLTSPTVIHTMETFENGLLQLEIPDYQEHLISTPYQKLLPWVLEQNVLGISKQWFLGQNTNVSPILMDIAAKTETTTETDNEVAVTTEDTPQAVEADQPTKTVSPVTEVDSGRVLFGREEMTHQPVYWEFNHEKLPNRHLLIFGRSGQGKTYCIQGILQELAKAQCNSMVVDYTNGFLPDHLEPEFQEAVNPKTHLVAHSPLAINPFRKQKQLIAGIELADQPHVVAGRVSSVFNSVYSTIGEQQLATLNNVIENGIQCFGEDYTFQQLLTHLAEESKVGEALANKLSTMVKSNLFDTRAEGGWDAIYNSTDCHSHMIQLASIPTDVQRLATEFILWDLYAHASSTGSKHNPLPVVLDEVQNLDHRLDSPLGKMLTEGRKYGLSLILATQTLSNLSKDEQDRLFQAAHKLFFAPAETEIKKYAEILEVTVQGSKKQHWIEQLSKLKKGQCLSVGQHLNQYGELELSVKKINISSLGER